MLLLVLLLRAFCGAACYVAHPACLGRWPDVSRYEHYTRLIVCMWFPGRGNRDWNYVGHIPPKEALKTYPTTVGLCWEAMVLRP